MAIYRCTHCGHTVTEQPKRRKAKPPAAPIDTSALSLADVFAHYKQTAPLEDIRFTLRFARLSDGLRADFETLEADTLAGLKRADVYRRYVNLQDRWRHESNRRQFADTLIEAYAVPMVAGFLPAFSEGSMLWPDDTLSAPS